MQKIKDFCKRHRLLWLTLLMALAAAAVAAWAGFDLGQRVDNQPVYEIVNDDYTRTVVIPATADAATQDDGTTGLYLPVPLKSGQRIYGVRLDLTTHNWAFRHGTLYAALLDADGNAVANGELDCITIKDDTFAAITFDAPYNAPGTADAEADYDLANPNMTLRLWHTPGDDWDVYHLLGLWTDADTSQQMTRRNANGTTDSIAGHPALQYVVNDSGSWSHVISRLLGVLTFAAVVAGFILLTHRAKLWQVVLVCGAVLGVAFAFLTPPLVGPDEYTHLAKCYRQSSTLLGQPVADDDDMLLVRSCDAPYFKNHTGDIGIYAYKEMLEHLGDAGCSGETTVSSDTYVTADPINNTLYLGQIAGITLARMMGLGTGKTAARKSLEINIPAGIDDDQNIALRGQGDAGSNGGPAGDVIVHVTVKADPMFERDGYDVTIHVPITFSQAVLGDDVEVPTVDGRIVQHIPEGTQSGTKFRLRGQGIQYLNGRGRGDQYVIVDVEIPKKVTRAQREALKAFEDSMKEDNYEKRKGFFKNLRDRFS